MVIIIIVIVINSNRHENVYGAVTFTVTVLAIVKVAESFSCDFQ